MKKFLINHGFAAAMGDDMMTETWLARRFKPFLRLEDLLQQHRHPAPYKYRGLVIGAGLDTSTELRLVRLNLRKELQELADSRFSFEPFEVAALLERLCTDYEVVVYDCSQTVLDRVKSQQHLPVGFLCDVKGGEQDEYIKRLAGTFPTSVRDGAVAWRSKPERYVVRETLLLLPTVGFLQRMSFVYGDARRDLGSVAGTFDVVTVFNTNVSEVPSDLASLVNTGGFVCIGTYGPSRIEVPQGFKAVYTYNESIKETRLDWPYAEAILLKVA